MTPVDPFDLPGVDQPADVPADGPSPFRVVSSAFLWAAGGYALAVGAGVALCVLLAISGPAFSITTPLFRIAALTTPAGKATSFSIETVPFCLAAGGCGAVVAALRTKVAGRRAKR